MSETDKLLVAFWNNHFRLCIDTLNYSGLSNMPGDASVTPALTRLYSWFSAIVSEDYALMDDLLAHGLPIDIPHPLRHTTALMEATRLGRTTLVSWLLSRGAAPAFLCGLPRGTPLHCALRRHHWEIARALIDAQTGCGDVDHYSRTPLHLLSMDMPDEADAILAALEVAEALLKKGCQMDALDHEGITALHYCIINDNAPLAQLLLDSGANPNILTPDTHVSPLTIAALEKNVTMAQLLLGYGADPHLPTKEGSTAFTIMPSLKRLSAATPVEANVTAPGGGSSRLRRMN